MMYLQRSLIALLATTVLAFSSMAANDDPLPGKVVTIDQERFEKLSEEEQRHVLDVKQRLERVYQTDRTSLTAEERRELRSELKELKREMKDINARGPMIYVSVTLLLVIVILVLLLR